MLTMRQIAERAGVSVATVSRVLHGQPGVGAATSKRLLKILSDEGYELDPAVSLGMSKIRRKDFYQETLAWCCDGPPNELRWLNELFEASKTYGKQLGYRIEFFPIKENSKRELSRLSAIWRARGYRGIILGPMHEIYPSLPFRWEQFSWVSIGGSLAQLRLHHVGRDYDDDILRGFNWLKDQGCQNPGVLYNRATSSMFRLPIIRELGVAGQHAGSMEFYCDNTEEIFHWLDKTKPDGLMVAPPLPFRLEKFRQIAEGRPTVYLSSIHETDQSNEMQFSARYDVIGQVAVNILHRLIRNGETGIPSYKQSVQISSRCSKAIQDTEQRQ